MQKYKQIQEERIEQLRTQKKEKEESQLIQKRMRVQQRMSRLSKFVSSQQEGSEQVVVSQMSMANEEDEIRPTSSLKRHTRKEKNEA
jgi:hypothetical protein